MSREMATTNLACDFDLPFTVLLPIVLQTHYNIYGI